MIHTLIAIEDEFVVFVKKNKQLLLPSAPQVDPQTKPNLIIQDLLETVGLTAFSTSLYRRERDQSFYLALVPTRVSGPGDVALIGWNKALEILDSRPLDGVAANYIRGLFYQSQA